MEIIKKVSAAFIAAALMLVSLSGTAFAGTYVLSGDADGDGKITSTDSRLILRYSTDIDIYSFAHLKICDIDSDSKITALDAREVLRRSVNLAPIPDKKVYVCTSEYKNLINGEPENPAFRWNVPPIPEVKAGHKTFTFTAYGHGHGVGLSIYGSLSLEDAGYTYDKILSHYYSGTELKDYGYYPQLTYYPTTGYIDTEQLVARITYQEIYGVTENGRYKEAIKAQAAAVFTIIAYNNFFVANRWDVGIASPMGYYNLPHSFRQTVHEVMGEYITVKGSKEPIMSVYSNLAAGMTAASEDVWGGELSYLKSVESPFDMDRSGFISTMTFTENEIYRYIKAYYPGVKLSKDPAGWLEIIDHSESIDSKRGYVRKLRVGNKIISGPDNMHLGSMRSSCFYITYTP